MAHPQAIQKKVIKRKEWNKRLADIAISKEDMNKLVMNFFITEGYVDSAEKFRQESGIVSEIDLATITERKVVKKALMAGNVDEAIEKLDDLNPKILETNTLLFFHLQLQRFIEILKQDRDDNYMKACEFANEALVPIVEANQNFLEEMEQTFVLMIFDSTSIATCPSKELLGQKQRNKRASEVNAAILGSQNLEKDPKLETLLKVLIWAQSQLGEMAYFPRVTNIADATVQVPPPC